MSTSQTDKFIHTLPSHFIVSEITENTTSASQPQKTMKKHSIVALLALSWLAGCNGQDSEPNTQQAEVIKEQKTLTV